MVRRVIHMHMLCETAVASGVDLIINVLAAVQALVHCFQKTPLFMSFNPPFLLASIAEYGPQLSQRRTIRALTETTFFLSSPPVILNRSLLGG